MINMYPEFDTKLFNEIYPKLSDFMNDYGQLGIPTSISTQNANTLYYLLVGRFGNSPIANWDENQFKIKLQATIWQFGPTWEKRLDIQTQLRALSKAEILNGGSRNLAISGSEDTTSANTTGNTRTLNTTDNQSGGDYTNTISGGNTKSTSNGAVITNHATNPGEIASSSGTGTSTALTYIDSQTAQIDKDKIVTNERTSNEVNAHVRDSADVIQHTGTIGDSGTQNGTNSIESESTHNETKTKAVLDAYAELWELLDNDVTNDFLAKFQKLFKQFVRPAHTFIYETPEELD